MIQGHLSITPMLDDGLRKYRIDISVHTAQPIAKPGCQGWTPEVFTYLKLQLAKVGGTFTPIICRRHYK